MENPFDSKVRELGTPTEKTKEEIKPLSENSKLKARIHQMSLMDAIKSKDLFMSQMKLRERDLAIQGAALEKEFQAESGTDKRFDWSSLQFK